MKTQEEKLGFVEMRAEGLSYDKIARRLGISKPTLLKWGRELEVEIAVRKDELLDEFHERYSLGKSERLQFLAEVFSATKSEWETRHLTDMPDTAVFQCMMKAFREIDKHLESAESETVPVRTSADEATLTTTDEDSHSHGEIESVSSPGVFTGDVIGSEAGLPESVSVPPSGSNN